MPRRNLNYNEKFKLIKCVDQFGVNSAQNTFHVSRRTVLRAIHNKKRIEESVEDGKGKMKRIDNAATRIDIMLLNYISKMNDKGYPLTMAMICEQAVKLMDQTSFKGTAGWFQKFKKRCHVKHGKLSGESAGIDYEMINNYKLNVIPLIKKYPPNRRYNVDETSIFYRQLPSKTFFISKGKHYGTKVNKERITVLFGCNQIGEKLPPLIISKSKNPRGRYNQIRERGIILESNKTAWMVKSIFFNFMNNWQEQLKNKGEKVALILDNFAGHKVNEDLFPNIEFFWLHPNSTCFLQPLDAGIIRSFKSKFVKKILERIMKYFEDNLSIHEISKNISLFDAVEWLADSWDGVTTRTIVNCWRKSGYNDDNEYGEVETMNIDYNVESDEVGVDDEDKDLEKLLDSIPINSKEKRTLVQYMKNLSILDTETYLFDNEFSTRGI